MTFVGIATTEFTASTRDTDRASRKAPLAGYMTDRGGHRGEAGRGALIGTVGERRITVRLG